MSTPTLSPIHPGEVLLEEFLKPLGITQYQLAKDISVPARRINEIVHGKRAITADTALRLARYFSLSEAFWLNLQARFDLETQKERLAHRLDAEVKVLPGRAKAKRRTLGVTLAYAAFEPAHGGIITDEGFGADVTLVITLPLAQVAPLTAALREATAGQAAVVEIG